MCFLKQYTKNGPILADKENKAGLIIVVLQQQTIVYRSAVEAKTLVAEGLYEYLKPTLKVSQLHYT